MATVTSNSPGLGGVAGLTAQETADASGLAPESTAAGSVAGLIQDVVDELVAQANTGGAGAVDAATNRVVLATDDPLVVALTAGIVTRTTTVTRPADTTAYSVGDAISNSTSAPTSGGFTITDAARASGKSGIITDVIVAVSKASGALTGEIWLFDAAVTNVNDNSAFAISDAEALTVVAIIPFTTVADTNNGLAHVTNLAIGFTTSGSANLRFLLKAKAAYTPISEETISVRFKIAQVN